MDALIFFLSQLQTWHWLAFALVLLIAEIATGTTYLLWPAAAAAITGLALLALAMNWQAQLGAFALATIALTVTGRIYVRGRWLNRGHNEKLNERGLAMIGQRAVAQTPFNAGYGQVKYADSVWRAASQEPISAGEQVVIVGVEGATLNVKKGD